MEDKEGRTRGYFFYSVAAGAHVITTYPPASVAGNVVMPKPQAEQKDSWLHFFGKCSLYATVPKMDSGSAISPLRPRHQNEGSRKHTCFRSAGVIGIPPQKFSMLPGPVVPFWRQKALHFGSTQKMMYGGVRNRDLLLGRLIVCGLLDMLTDTQLVTRVEPI